MDTAYLKKVGQTLLFAVVSLFFIFYIGYHLYNGFTTDISTVIAEKNTYRSEVTANGFVFRNETCIDSSFTGAVNYIVKNGEKIAIGTNVAQAFADNAGYAAGSEISDIEKTVTLLEGCLEEASSSGDINAVSQKISSAYSLVLSRLAEGKIDFALGASDDLLLGLTKKDIITGNAENFEKTISDLRARRDRLSSSISGKYENIISEASGYFFYETDGFEETFNADRIMNATLDELFALATGDHQPDAGAENHVGKIISDYRWYIALPLTSKPEHDFKAGLEYDVMMPGNFNTVLKMRLERLVTEKGGERSVLIFSCGEMPEGFNFKRSQTVTVYTGETEGFRIPTTALRVIDGIAGVYTLDGSTVRFKRVHIIQNDVDGYYVASSEDRKDAPGADTYGYLRLYDSIIVSGKDLKHGMVFY